jgi:hypothetical protein
MANLPCRNLRPNFNTSVFDTCTLPCGQSRALHWIYDPPSCSIANRRASFRIASQIEWLIGRKCSARVGRRWGICKALSDIERAICDIIDKTVDDGIFTNVVGC